METQSQPLRIGVVGLITIGSSGAGASGGVEKLIEEVSVRLAARGNHVTVYCRGRYNPGKPAEFNGVRLRNLPAVYTKHLEAITHSFVSMLVAMTECDVVQVHSMGPALLSFMPRVAGRKSVCTLHGLDWKRDKWGPLAKRVLKAGEWCALRFPNHTTVVSRALKAYCAERHRKAVTYIPNGVPALTPRAIDTLARFGVARHGYILYLGRIVPEKGLHYLIPAFRALDTPLKLLVVGDARHAGEYATRVKKLAEGDERIVFAGPLYGEEKEAAYSNARVFCMPSDVEGMPIVLLEAMGLGLCCLTSDIPEAVEVFGGAETGATFRQGNVDDLSTQLAALLADELRMDALGAAAKAHATREYSWDRIAERYEAVYRAVHAGEAMEPERENP